MSRIMGSTDVEGAAQRAAKAGATSARRLVGWSILGLVAAAGTAAGLLPEVVAGALPATAPAEYCATSPAQARVDPQTAPDHQYEASVPADNPVALVSTRSYTVRKGDVIAFAVASSRPGRIAVHGLHDLQDVQIGGTVQIAFRTLYSGRFPLHFHGADGSHFELAALEVQPAPPSGVSR